MISIHFVLPTHIHPNSNNTKVSDLGKILESKYGLIGKFIKLKQPQLEKRFTKHLFSVGYKDFHRLESWIQAEWRGYMVSQLHRIKTKSATKEGRESFIDTGNYYRSLQVVIKVS